MATLKIGETAPDFTLPATDGKTYQLAEAFKDAKSVVVVFTCNHCPYAQAWEDRINAFARDYAAKEVRVLAINSNNAVTHPSDSFESMVKRAQDKRFVFPYLHDESQSVARLYGAERTPELFIFDAQRALRYHGAFDDNYEEPHAVKLQYAKNAVDAILAGGQVTLPETRPVGCTIKWKS
jgi:peroxiredoxin